MPRARCGRASGLPSRPIASWKPPPTWSAPSFHHSGSATSNSQPLSAAASLATSLMLAASAGEGLRSSPPGSGRSSLAARAIGIFRFILHEAPSAEPKQRLRRLDRTIALPRHAKGRTLKEPVLVTGAAGFIGMHVARRLLADGHHVVGVDNLNAYYDPRFKEPRVAFLTAFPNFQFEKIKIADRRSPAELFPAHPFPHVVQLAPPAALRTSLS